MSTSLALDEFMEGQWQGPWSLLRTEPFPEQWDTFVAAAGAEHHMAPVEINRQHLLREGYPAEHIHLIGGVVVDALRLKQREKPETSIFALYPQLADGRWIRLDIHRKENLGERRFKAIFQALETVVARGHRVTLVLMNATKHAIKRWDLSERLAQLQTQANFLATEVWPAYSHVVEFYSSANCLAAWTDSGGVQEDMNLLGKPCLTCRFNTDRPETIMGNHGNILVPPISGEFLSRVVCGIVENEHWLGRLTGARSLYGEKPGENFAAAIMPYALRDDSAHRLSHEILGFGLDETHFERSF